MERQRHTTTMPSLRTQSHGMSLVSVMVSIGIVGILAASANTYFKNSLSAAKKVSDKNEYEELRRHVRIAANCQMTLAALPANCPPNRKIAIKMGNRTPADLIAKPHSIFGKNSLRASCTNVRHEFDIEVRYKDGEWKKLFPKDLPFACRGD